MEIGVIFDLDGTLLDTLADLADAVNYALAQFGYPPRTLDEVRAFVGNGAGMLIRRATEDGPDQEQVLALFRGYYDAHCRIKTAPYPGIPQSLERIGRRHKMAVVSNKPDSAVKRLCADFFGGIPGMGESPVCPRKPAPDMVFRAMEAIGVDGCVYVGDSEVDVQTARNAGVRCVSVLWGFRERSYLETQGAACFCEKAEDLPEIIEKIIGEQYGK